MSEQDGNTPEALADRFRKGRNLSKIIQEPKKRRSRKLSTIKSVKSFDEKGYPIFTQKFKEVFSNRSQFERRPFLEIASDSREERNQQHGALWKPPKRNKRLNFVWRVVLNNPQIQKYVQRAQEEQIGEHEPGGGNESRCIFGARGHQATYKRRFD